jgi:8-amino-7-oxononanoate synthase
MSAIDDYILSKLEQRKKDNNFRSLKITEGLTDFYSNDYLGFARSEKLQQKIQQELGNIGVSFIGSTGSRLLSGNNNYVESLEKYLAQFHGIESALLFNSGFDANYGLLSTLPYRGDTIIYDELVHASIHDGIRNSRASSVPFRHNSAADLEEKLRAATGLKYIVIESLYSMDGDLAPLKEITHLAEKYGAGLIIDEAHATGIMGNRGEGFVGTEIPDKPVLARIHTFGKALGAHGAVVLCSENLRQFLINYCRPFIFSTALPLHSLVAIKCAYEMLEDSQALRQKLSSLISLFRKQVKEKENFQLITSDSPIQSIIVSGNSNAKEFAAKIQQKGMDVRAILHPTVARGKERIRICLHSFNTEQEVNKLAEIINSL